MTDNSFKLNEFTLQGSFSNYSLIIGKQAINWGKNEFSNSLNLFSFHPNQENETNWLSNWQWYGKQSQWQVIYIPFSKNNKQTISDPSAKTDDSSSELGLRYSLQLAQSDIAFYAAQLLSDDLFYHQQQYWLDRYYLIGSSAEIAVNDWIVSFDGMLKSQIDTLHYDSAPNIQQNHLLDYAIALQYQTANGFNLYTGWQQQNFINDIQLQFNPVNQQPLHKRQVVWVINMSQSWWQDRLLTNGQIIRSDHSKFYLLYLNMQYLLNDEITLESQYERYFIDQGGELNSLAQQAQWHFILTYDF